MSKILVIDDDIAICELVKINLELQGYECFYSTDPIKGFAYIKQEKPNLVILDVMMGNVNGFDIAKKNPPFSRYFQNSYYYVNSII